VKTTARGVYDRSAKLVALYAASRLLTQARLRANLHRAALAAGP